jgi:hypothetical protein
VGALIDEEAAVGLERDSIPFVDKGLHQRVNASLAQGLTAGYANVFRRVLMNLCEDILKRTGHALSKRNSGCSSRCSGGYSSIGGQKQ